MAKKTKGDESSTNTEALEINTTADLREEDVSEKKYHETTIKCYGCGDMLPVKVEMGKSVHAEMTGKKHEKCGEEIIPTPEKRSTD